MWKTRVEEALLEEKLEDRFSIIWKNNIHPSACKKSLQKINTFIEKLNQNEKAELTQ